MKLKSYSHKLAICSYIDTNHMEKNKLQQWLGWHQRRGISKFYLYVLNCTKEWLNALEDEIESGLVELLPISSNNVARLRQTVYNDCLWRGVECKYIAFVDMGEFLRGTGENSLISTIEEQIASSDNSFIYIGEGANRRFIVSTDGFKRDNLLAYNEEQVKEAQGIAITTKAPARVALVALKMKKGEDSLDLLSTATTFVKAGYDVDIISAWHDDMESDFKKVGAHVVTVSHNACIKTLEKQNWYKTYDLIIMDTEAMEECLEKKTEA